MHPRVLHERPEVADRLAHRPGAGERVVDLRAVVPVPVVGERRVPAQGEDPAVGEGDQGGVPAAAAGDPEAAAVVQPPAVGLGPPQAVHRAVRGGPEQVELVGPAADHRDRAAADRAHRRVAPDHGERSVLGPRLGFSKAAICAIKRNDNCD